MNLLIALAALLAQDTSEAARIVVQHDGRGKPLDTFARQFMQSLTEKERFVGYKDPATNQTVTVFPTGDPVFAVLKMVAQPAEIRELRFIKITHPELKKQFGLNEGLTYYSLADLQPAREKLLEEMRSIDFDNATSAQRAVLKIVKQFREIESMHQERLLAIIPVPFGENNSWMTPVDLRRWLGGTSADDPRSQDIAVALDLYVRADPKRREALENVSRRWSAALGSFAAGDLSGFTGLADELRALNPPAYPSTKRVATELFYGTLRPFHRASALLAVAWILFLLGMVFESRKVGWIGYALLLGGIAMMLWGYGLRWIIAGRYPLSNHYESMAMCALGACLLTAILELVLKTKRVVGMSGSLVGCILLVLANEVPTFAEQGFVAPLVPALQTVWMTIHVPVIMIGYAMGMLLAVLGHVHLIKLIAHKDDPSWVESIEKIMYRVLQLTVLFLLVGIILGAVWAGEAWGRPWGWDMKETWALITLLCYLAMLHARFVGFLKPFWMSVSSLFSFAILILTYYGVNFLFGKGLHTYGFGSGDWFWLSLFFGIEAVLVGVATVVYVSRGPKGEITGDAMKLREE